MVEYVFLLALTTGTHWLERASRAFAGDPRMVWGGAAVVALLIGWLVRPGR